MVGNKFWKDRKVLVTGFEGFLGSHLVRSLMYKKAKVIGLDIKTFRKDTILEPGDYRRMVVYKGSVADRALVRRILRKHAIDTIFHLAAEAIVCRGHTNPLKAFKSNIAGTWEILDASRLHGGIQAIVVASSDKAYGSHKKLPYREDAGLIANHPYDVSKSCADLIASTYSHTYNLPVAVTRCGNIYGPGDFNFSRLIPDALRCVFSGRILKIRSDGRFIRDYVYIDDIVDGYIRIAELLKKRNLAGEAFNLSDERPLTVMDVLKEINRLNGGALKYRIMNTARYEIKKQYLSSSKARNVLGWRPRHSFKDGLKKTVDWYCLYLRKR